MDGITDSMDLSLSKLQKMVKEREAWCAAVHGVTKSRTSPDCMGCGDQHPYHPIMEKPSPLGWQGRCQACLPFLSTACSHVHPWWGLLAAHGKCQLLLSKWWHPLKCPRTLKYRAVAHTLRSTGLIYCVYKMPLFLLFFFF